MDKAKLAVETTQAILVANEDEAHAMRALDDLELMLAGGGGDGVNDWG